MEPLNQGEVKQLSLKFIDSVKNHFQPTKGSRDETARQMLTVLSALKLTLKIIEDQASDLGFEFVCEVVSSAEMEKAQKHGH